MECVLLTFKMQAPARALPSPRLQFLLSPAGSASGLSILSVRLSALSAAKPFSSLAWVYDDNLLTGLPPAAWPAPNHFPSNRLKACSAIFSRVRGLVPDRRLCAFQAVLKAGSGSGP